MLKLDDHTYYCYTVVKKSSSHGTGVHGVATVGHTHGLISIGILQWRRARVSSWWLSCSNLSTIILHGHLWTESIIATKKKKKIGFV